jgi:hypothetical protein
MTKRTGKRSRIGAGCPARTLREAFSKGFPEASIEGSQQGFSFAGISPVGKGCRVASYLEVMKATSTAAQQIEHPPLARDAQGNLLAIPDGTRAWRISRHTKGRPRIVNGPDKQPARFPLDTTLEDLADACGADAYRVYAIDEVGTVIDYVTTVEVGRELRNASEPEVMLMPSPRVAAGSSDLRYALEAVAHMARTNADAMRAVAESQAEWIKSISSARGFFRNAPQLQLSAPAEAEAGDDDDDDSEAERRPDWIEALQPVVGMVVQQLIASITAPKKPAIAGEQPVKLELADLFDWRRVERKREDAQRPPLDSGALQQALAGKAMAIGALLEPSEQARLMKLAPMLSKLAADPEISKMLAELVAMSVEDSAAWVRAHLDEIEKGLAS